MADDRPEDERIFSDPRVEPRATEGQTRTENMEVRDSPTEREMSSTMKWALFLTIAAVFVVGPCLVLLVFGGFAELVEEMGLEGLAILPR